MDEAMKKLMADLAASVKALHETVSAKFSTVDPAKAEAEKDALVKQVMDMQEALKALQKAKAVRKMVFEVNGKKAGEGEEAVNFGSFLRAVIRDDQKFMEAANIKTANGQSEGTNADGGYAVPIEFASEIIKLQQLHGIARRICRLVPMGTLTRYVPSQLTRPTATYTDEATNHTKTKVTLDRITQTAKKLSAVVPFTEEFLADNNVNFDSFLFQSVAEAFARVEDEQVFSGSGSPFTGIANASGVNAVTMGGATLAYDDIVDLMFSMNAAYRTDAMFALSSTALKLIMKLKDDNNNPLWSMPVAGAPGTILGRKYVETDAITAAIFFGDFKNVWISDNGSYEVKASDSASDANGGAGSAFLQDEIWYRFKQRHAINVMLPAAFGKITSVA